jgi:hypothetical protein
MHNFDLRAVADIHPRAVLICWIDWWGYGVGRTFSNFNYQLRPIGYVDGFLKDDGGSIRLFGWAGEPTSGIELEEVRVYIDTDLVATTKTNQPRPDVVLALGQPKFSQSGWEIRLSATHRYKDTAMVEVVAVSQNGTSTVLHSSPIDAAL